MILNEIKYELTPKEEKNFGSLIKEKIFSIYMAFIHIFSSSYSEKKLRLVNEVINLYDIQKNEKNAEC